MSTPQNHHYVSQCQIRSFFNKNTGKIYLYDKKQDNFFSKPTTKSIFSERLLNSKVINGKVDHNEVEDDLRIHLEKNYGKNLKTVENYNPNDLESQRAFMNALMEMIRLGSIGEFRHPTHKKHIDDQIFGVFETLAKHAIEKLKQELDEQLEERKMTPYSNEISYAEISGKVLAAMGNIDFTVLYIKEKDLFFILPDCSSTTSRAKINIYFNPDIKEIASIIMPISSKIAIMAAAKNLNTQRGGIKHITRKEKEAVDIINHTTLAGSKKMVACENKNYLDDFIKRQKEFYQKMGMSIKTTYIM